MACTRVSRSDVQDHGALHRFLGTVIHCMYMSSMRAELNARGENPCTLDVVKPVIVKFKEVMKGWIKVRMVDGKAKGLL